MKENQLQRNAIDWPCFRCMNGGGKLEVMPAGLLDLKQAQEWVVTTKLGTSDKRPGTQAWLSTGMLGTNG